MEDNSSNEQPVAGSDSRQKVSAVTGPSFGIAAGGGIEHGQASVIRDSRPVGESGSGRLGFRVGRPLGSGESFRPVESSLGSLINKHQGAASDFSCVGSLEEQAGGVGGVSVYGQCGCSSDCKKKGICEVVAPKRGSREDRSFMCRGVNYAQSSPCSRGAERGRGQFISVSSSSIGVESSSCGVPADLLLVGCSRSGPLCNARKRENSCLRLPSSHSNSTGLFYDPVGSVDTNVCFSTDEADGQVSVQSSSDEAVTTADPGLSLVGEEAMVRIIDGSDGTPRSCSPQPSGSGLVPGSAGQDGFPLQSRHVGPSRSAIVRKELEYRKWDSATIEVLESSLRPQSRVVYDRFWAEFVEFALSKVSAISEVSLSTLTAFLHHLAFVRKLQVSTIKSYVSAIKFPLQLVLKEDITDSPMYVKFMKGLVALCPVQRPLPVSWNLEVVLMYLRGFEHMSSLSAEDILNKCLFLVAVATGKRVSELAHLGWDEPYLRLSKSSASLIYTPEFLAKNETPVSLHSPICIQSVSSTAPDDEERFVCPVRALYYWRCCIKKNPNRDPLQLFQLPSGAKASVREISRRLVQVIKKSHESLKDADARLLKVRAHDVRAVAASKVWNQRLAWSDLAGTFAWRNRNVFISVYSRGMSALREIRSD